ncbi:hypothetical protein E2C01_092321 [Portunus trituberculatus]|uniref:Uncharacterized protein n=1 Tax=Portunus trituberculatus TaxID=210409 RepID=A0A5B7JRE6_PORTR|nr:hypothetical protein [Portunus trituberculatus]
MELTTLVIYVHIYHVYAVEFSLQPVHSRSGLYGLGDIRSIPPTPPFSSPSSVPSCPSQLDGNERFLHCRGAFPSQIPCPALPHHIIFRASLAVYSNFIIFVQRLATSRPRLFNTLSSAIGVACVGSLSKEVVSLPHSAYDRLKG